MHRSSTSASARRLDERRLGISVLRRQVAIGLLLAWLPAAGTVAQAQTTGGGSILDRLQRLQGGASGAVESPPVIPVIPLEQPIDAERYRLFPGDQLHLGIWGENPGGLSLTVSPEGDLIIPKAGLVRITGCTLREAEERVRTELRPMLGRSRITLRLLAPGKYRVAIAGLVTRPGLYELTGTHRVSDLIEAAGGIRPGGSLRTLRIGSLHDSTGADRTIDIFPWILRGDPESNPLLFPGLEVEVPPFAASVRIRGPVNGRGALQAAVLPPARIGDRPEEEADLLVELRPGDTIGTLLEQVGGLSDRAARSGILRRAGTEPVTLDLDAPADGATALQDGDVLEVGYLTRWVFVTGSVRSPGRFPYFSGLQARDYVAMAGGPSEIGRQGGWTIDPPGEDRRKVDPGEEIPSGAVLRVPERTTYRLTAWLSPLSTATALIISVVALSK